MCHSSLVPFSLACWYATAVHVLFCSSRGVFPFRRCNSRMFQAKGAINKCENIVSSSSSSSASILSFLCNFFSFTINILSVVAKEGREKERARFRPLVVRARKKKERRERGESLFFAQAKPLKRAVELARTTEGECDRFSAPFCFSLTPVNVVQVLKSYRVRCTF